MDEKDDGWKDFTGFSVTRDGALSCSVRRNPGNEIVDLFSKELRFCVPPRIDNKKEKIKPVWLIAFDERTFGLQTEDGSRFTLPAVNFFTHCQYRDRK